MTEDKIISPKYTLAEVVNGYLLRAGNINRKYYRKYEAIAQDIYEKLYTNTMPTTISKYMQVFPAGPGDEYPYIKRPYGMTRFFGVSVTNKNNELLSVYQNDKLNVFTKPPIIKSGCGCASTELCDCIDNLQVVITEKFELDGTKYYEKTWVKCCDNGDVLQYSENPILNTCSSWFLAGSILGPATFSYTRCDGTVVQSQSIDDTGLTICISDLAPITITSGNGIKTKIGECTSVDQVVTVITSYKNLGRLETKDCGCPIESEANRDIIFKKCGCFLTAKPQCCKVWYDKSHIDCTGDYKWSECETKLYLKNVKDDGGFAIMHFQVDPISCDTSEILIDSFARWPIWYGMDLESNVFNPRSNPKVLREMERKYQKAINEHFEYLNPMDPDRLFNMIITAEIKL